MREGLPVLPRRSPAEHARFDLEAVRAWLESRSDDRAVSIEQRVARLERQLATLGPEPERDVVAIRKRGDNWTVKVYDPNAPGRQRWVGTFHTRQEAIDAEAAATLGIAPSARARTIRDWSMIWLRGYVRPARSTQRTYRHAFRVVKQRWGKRERLDLYELRHACATLLMERGLPPHVVANQLGHTDGGAFVQRLDAHPSERGMRDQIRLAFASWGADREQATRKLPGNA